MFDNLKIGKKLALGFGAVLTLLIVVLLVSIWGFNKADKGTAAYRELARDTNLAGLLQANMLMVRMNIKDFLLTKSEQDLQQYHDYQAKMQGFLQQAKQEIKQPERVALVTKIAEASDVYQSAFAKVVELTRQQDALHKSKLIASGKKMTMALEKLLKAAKLANDKGIVNQTIQVQEKMLVGRLFVVKFLHTAQTKHFNGALHNMDRLVSEEFDNLNNNAQASLYKLQLAEFNDAHRNYVAAMHDIHDLLIKRDKIIQKTLNILGPQVARNVEKMKLSVMQDQEALGSELTKMASQSIKYILLLSVFALVAGFGATYFLTKSIVSPIKKAVRMADQLAHGDLSVNVGTTTKDEAGMLLEAIQNTANNLKKMLQVISDASDELAAASEELAVVSESSLEGIVKQESETELVATAMGQMATTVHDVADNAMKAADAASQANSEARSGARVVEDTITSINSLSVNVNDSSVKLNEVQQQVLNISTILDVIRGVADQTNLLALNAAIEAARAGEQGRGFAVVADEVRSLAARTQDSTAEIQSIIEQLQRGTKSTVEVMDIGKSQADNCVIQAQEASSALSSITSAIAIINDMNIQIASASEQQSSVAESINKNVTNVKQVAQENSVASDQIRGSTTEIAKLAEQLNHLVLQFKM